LLFVSLLFVSLGRECDASHRNTIRNEGVTEAKSARTPHTFLSHCSVTDVLLLLFPFP